MPGRWALPSCSVVKSESPNGKYLSVDDEMPKIPVEYLISFKER